MTERFKGRHEYTYRQLLGLFAGGLIALIATAACSSPLLDPSLHPGITPAPPPPIERLPSTGPTPKSSIRFHPTIDIQAELVFTYDDSGQPVYEARLLPSEQL